MFIEFFYTKLILIISIISLCATAVLFKLETIGTLNVPIGGQVYLYKGLKLPFINKGVFYAKVLDHEPIYLVAGSVHPKVFSSVSNSQLVAYYHNGLPFLSKDRIFIRVYESSTNQTVQKNYIIKVNVYGSHRLITLNNSLSVDQRFGMSGEIDSNIFQFNIPLNSPCSIEYQENNKFPMHGNIIDMNGFRRIEHKAFKCLDFLELGDRYKHSVAISSNEDYIMILVKTIINNTEVSERICVKITLSFNPTDLAPVIFTTSSAINAFRFVLTPIDPLSISVQDFATPSDLITLNLTKSSVVNYGSIIHLRDLSRPITSFLSSDVKKFMIVYKPPPSIQKVPVSFILSFVAIDSYNKVSEERNMTFVVRPSSNLSPQVYYNHGLTVIEGGAVNLSLKNLKIHDEDNLLAVKLTVTGGLNHGTLIMNSQPAITFGINDLYGEKIKYQHDDSEFFHDFINFLVTDGGNEMSFKFPIIVLPKDDQAPNLVKNNIIEMQKGQIKFLDSDNFKVEDYDSNARTVTFNLIKKPNHGKIMKQSTSRKVETMEFTYGDVISGLISYEHDNSVHFNDSFNVILSDEASPPNLSPTYQIKISIFREKKKLLCFGHCLKQMVINESSISIINKDMIHFHHANCNDQDVVYKIAPLTFSVNSSKAFGKLVLNDDLMEVDTQDHMKPLTEFTQLQINHFKVAFVTAGYEIGLKPIAIQFKFNVSCQNFTHEDIFEINVTPVDNKSPIIRAKNIELLEGKNISIDQRFLEIFDSDTVALKLIINACALPQNGQLMLDNHVLNDNDIIKLEDIKYSRLIYAHNGDENRFDEFKVCASDSIQSSSAFMKIIILPLNDEPKFYDGLLTYATVAEQQSFAFTLDMINGNDSDDSSDNLYFFISNPPEKGIVKVKNNSKRIFSLLQIAKHEVVYTHTSGEIGLKAINDSITFIIQNENLILDKSKQQNLSLHTIVIGITPVDNFKMRIRVKRRILVNEGQRTLLSFRNIKVSDYDTLGENIRFFVEAQPRFGFIENTGLLPGSEKFGFGIPIHQFTYQDVLQKKIYYFQSKHKKIEPRSDSFKLAASEDRDTMKSKILKFTVVIKPVNDESPIIRGPKKITVAEHRFVTFRNLDVIDFDDPKENLQVTVKKRPFHGDVIYSSNSSRVESALLKHFKLSVVYSHDGSERFHDNFTITVDDKKHFVEWTFLVEVIPLNDESPALKKIANLLDVPFGSWKLISERVLISDDKDLMVGNSVLYSILDGPSTGKIQKRLNITSTKWEDVKYFSQFDVARNLIRYKHNGNILKSQLYDSFKFYVTDKIHSTVVYVFNVTILHTDQSPLQIYVAKNVEVEAFSNITLDSTVLSASDKMNNPSSILFEIIRLPIYGQLLLASKVLSSGDTFNQVHLLSQKLIYKHLRFRKNSSEVFVYKAFNNVSEIIGRFYIKIIPPPTKAPIINRIIPLVASDGSTTISNKNLMVSDVDSSSDELQYIISKYPSHGLLMKNKSLLNSDTFTQQDIDNGFISYQTKNDSSFAHDHLLFKISDGEHIGILKEGRIVKGSVMRLDIHVKPALDSRSINIHAKVLTNLLHFQNGSKGFLISTKNCKVTNSLGQILDELQFKIVKKPIQFYVQNVKSNSTEIDLFTSTDVLNKNIRLIFKLEIVNNVQDSFTFEVIDKFHRVIGSKRVFVYWSIIEFESKVMQICENQTTSYVNVRRSGYSGGVSFVSIRSESITAELIKDYIPSRATQLQFDTSVRNTRWRLRIVKDNLEEASIEKFKIILFDPINSLLSSSKSVLMVYLTDLNNGKCNHSKLHILPTRNSKIPRTSSGITPTQRSNTITKPIQIFKPNFSTIKPFEATTSSTKRSCPSDWLEFESDCYIYVAEPVTKVEAEKMCMNLRGYLLIVKSADHNDWLRRLTSSNRFWIALTKDLTSNLWSYKFGSFKFRNWRSLRKSMRKTSAKCAIMLPQGKWMPKSCYYDKYPFVCLRPKM